MLGYTPFDSMIIVGVVLYLLSDIRKTLKEKK